MGLLRKKSTLGTTRTWPPSTSITPSRARFSLTTDLAARLLLDASFRPRQNRCSTDWKRFSRACNSVTIQMVDRPLFFILFIETGYFRTIFDSIDGPESHHFFCTSKSFFSEGFPFFRAALRFVFVL